RHPADPPGRNSGDHRRDGVIRVFRRWGPGVQASLYFPADLAIDRSGNLYVNDRGNNRLRMIDTDGIIRTLAGTGIPGSQGGEGPAALAQIDRILGLA